MRRSLIYERHIITGVARKSKVDDERARLIVILHDGRLSFCAIYIFFFFACTRAFVVFVGRRERAVVIEITGGGSFMDRGACDL